MSETGKVTTVRVRRTAVVYLRQSTPGQFEHNPESPGASARSPTERWLWASPVQRSASSTPTWV